MSTMNIVGTSVRESIGQIERLDRNERRQHPRVPLSGVVDLSIAEVVRRGEIRDISPAGLRLECSNQLIDYLNNQKSSEGLYPRLTVEFCLPMSHNSRACLSLLGQVSHCRRLRQDSYALGIVFIAVPENEDQILNTYIDEQANIW